MRSIFSVRLTTTTPSFSMGGGVSSAENIIALAVVPRACAILFGEIKIPELKQNLLHEGGLHAPVKKHYAA